MDKSIELSSSGLIRIPIIPSAGPGDWAAQKIASLFCDSGSHFIINGSPKLSTTDWIEERKTCGHNKKVLIVDRHRRRFCIAHDPGLENEVTLSGQWWELTPEGEKEANKIQAEYLNRMTEHTGSFVEIHIESPNWWEVKPGLLAPRARIISRPGQYATHGLTNNVAVAIPSALQEANEEDTSWELQNDFGMGDDYDMGLEIKKIDHGWAMVPDKNHKIDSMKASENGASLVITGEKIDKGYTMIRKPTKSVGNGERVAKSGWFGRWFAKP